MGNNGEEKSLIAVLKTYQSVIVYGAGNVSRTVLRYLKANYQEIHISAIVVTEFEGNPYYIYDVPVSQIDQLKIDQEHEIVLVATMERVQAEIASLLGYHGIKNIIYMKDSLAENWNCKTSYLKNDNLTKRYIVPYMDTFIGMCYEAGMPDAEIRKNAVSMLTQLKFESLNILRLVVVLGTKCSLRCRDCNNLMPYFKPQTDLDKQEILDSLEKITDTTQSILKCELIGGEPFLAKNFTDVLSYVLDNPVIKSVEITTNGTVVPDEEQAAFMQDPKVVVRISDYGSKVNKHKIIRFLESHHIRYQVLELGDWIMPGGTERRNRSEQELRECYGRCPSSYYCKTLYEGKIFSCARAASLHALGFMKENEYVDVGEKFDVKKMKEFLLRDYSVACDYCDISIDNKVFVTPAIQLGRREGDLLGI